MQLVAAPSEAEMFDPSCEFRAALGEHDVVYPVSSSGLHRGQALFQALVELRRGVEGASFRVAAPHGAEEGLDPISSHAGVTPRNKGEYLPMWEGAPDRAGYPPSAEEAEHDAAFRDAFQTGRVARQAAPLAAHLLVAAPEEGADMAVWRQVSEARRALRAHFDRFYWSARGLPSTARRVFVCLGRSTGVVVSRLLAVAHAHDLSLHRTVVLGLPLDGHGLRSAGSSRHVARARRAGHAAATSRSVLSRAYSDFRDVIAHYFSGPRPTKLPAAGPASDGGAAGDAEPQQGRRTKDAASPLGDPFGQAAGRIALQLTPEGLRRSPETGQEGSPPAPSSLWAEDAESKRALSPPEGEQSGSDPGPTDRARRTTAAFARMEVLAAESAASLRDSRRRHEALSEARVPVAAGDAASLPRRPKPTVDQFLAMVPGQRVDFRDYNGRYYNAEVVEVHPQRQELVLQYDVELLGQQRRHVLLAYASDYERVERAGDKTRGTAQREADRLQARSERVRRDARGLDSPDAVAQPVRGESGAPLERAARRSRDSGVSAVRRAEAALSPEEVVEYLRHLQRGDYVDVYSPANGWTRAVVTSPHNAAFRELVVEYAGASGRTRERVISTRLRPGLVDEVALPGTHTSGDSKPHGAVRAGGNALALPLAGLNVDGVDGSDEVDGPEGDESREGDDAQTKGNASTPARTPPRSTPQHWSHSTGPDAPSTAAKLRMVTTPGGEHLQFHVGDHVDYYDYDGAWHDAEVVEVRPSRREMFLLYTRPSGMEQRRHVMLDFSIDVKRLAPHGAYTGAGTAQFAAPAAQPRPQGSAAETGGPRDGPVASRATGAPSSRTHPARHSRAESGAQALQGPLNFSVGDELDFLDFDGTWQPARVVEVEVERRSVFIMHRKPSGHEQRRHIMLDLGVDVRRLAPRGAFTRAAASDGKADGASERGSRSHQRAARGAEGAGEATGAASPRLRLEDL